MKTVSILSLVVAIGLSLTGCNKSSDMNPEERELASKDQTTRDLTHAWMGECEANRKYSIYADIADQEGYPQIARLWRAAAAAEAVHARNHMKALGMMKPTIDNLQNAVEDEQYEFTVMYPKFIKTAQEAGRTEAAQSMEYAFEVEQGHYQLFLADLEDLKKGVKPADTVYWVCSVCGNTIPTTPPDVCNVCDSPKDRFFEVK